MQFGHEQNEVEQYLDAWYVITPKVVWHLFAMEMHEEQPNVICLVLDLPRMHRLVFNGNDDATLVLQIVEHESTTLIAYFARCVIDANARQYFNILFGILPQKDGHLDKLDLPWEGSNILLIQLPKNISTFGWFLQ